MERAEAKRIVDASLPRMKGIMGLEDWDITIQYRKVKDTKRNLEMGYRCMGTCKTSNWKDGEWDKKAIITLDVNKHDADSLISTLWHELAHCVVAVHHRLMCKSLSDLLFGMDDFHYQETIPQMYKYARDANEGLAQAVQKIAKNFLGDMRGQVTRCLKHGCPAEAAADICGVSMNYVRQIKAQME